MMCRTWKRTEAFSNRIGCKWLWQQLPVASTLIIHVCFLHSCISIYEKQSSFIFTNVPCPCIGCPNWGQNAAVTGIKRKTTHIDHFVCLHELI